MRSRNKRRKKKKKEEGKIVGTMARKREEKTSRRHRLVFAAGMGWGMHTWVHVGRSWDLCYAYQSALSTKEREDASSTSMIYLTEHASEWKNGNGSNTNLNCRKEIFSLTIWLVEIKMETFFSFFSLLLKCDFLSLLQPHLKYI